ncbi:MAG: hypothetical protein ABI895_27470 [Deltaproteobacteria bacterium]
MMDRKELERWTVDEPTPGFADRTVALLAAPRTAESAQRRRVYQRAPWRRVLVGLALAAGTTAGALAWWGLPREPLSGGLLSEDRTTVAIGGRALAVLEPATRLDWVGEQVMQQSGAVFYRVEPGRSTFRVTTPAGDVEVLGTCFRVSVGSEQGSEDRMKSRDLAAAGGGAALAAVVVVTVYEGKVHLVRENQSVVLEAGQSGKLDVHGAQPIEHGALGAAERALQAHRGGTAAAGTRTLATGNDAPGGSLRKLEDLEREKQDLQAQLRVLEEELNRQAPARTRSEWDLDQNDWKELAAKGHVKFRVPCLMPGGGYWKGPPAPQLDELGLSAEDGQAIGDAYRRSNERIWAVVRPLCLEAVGSEEVLNALGGAGCVQAINKKARSIDAEAARAASQLVADVRAGLRPEPKEKPQHPVFESLMAVTGEMKRFEADLAESFGPEEAKRLAWGPGCMNNMAL